MDRHEQIQNIKKLEADFINTIEGTIKDKYLNKLFTSYKKTINDIAECYKNPAYNFSESKQCAQASMTTYLNKEKSFEDLFNHYEVLFRLYGELRYP
jgi:hypothetical protein